MMVADSRGYIVAEITVHETETYDEYVVRSGVVLEKYGARLLVSRV